MTGPGSITWANMTQPWTSGAERTLVSGAAPVGRFTETVQRFEPMKAAVDPWSHKSTENISGNEKYGSIYLQVVT